MENLNLKHRCYMHNSFGKIVYDPIRNMKSEPWIAIVEVDQDLGDYYRLLFNNRFKVNLLKPNWKAHISLCKGAAEYNPHMLAHWGEKHGETVNFHYTTDIFWNNTFVWLNVYFPEYFYLREKMGLAHTHINNENWGHLTLGKFRKVGQLGNFTDYSYCPPKNY